MAAMRCPVCTVENSQGPACRRCRADLTLLFQVEERRARMMADARQLLANGSTEEADALANEVDWMRSDIESLRLRAMTQLMRRDFAGALAIHRTAAGTGTLV